MEVTTLIPAFKPKFLPQLLQALSCQTCTPARVIISDDSPNQVFISALKSIEDSPLARKLHLEVVRGPQQGGLANFRHLVRLFAGRTELFHILCDDDLIYPDFYRWHVTAQRSGYPCTVSRRWTADEQGQPLAALPAPEQVQTCMQSLLSLPAKALFPAVVPHANNWLGEVSNVVMHRDLADVYEDLRFEGIPYNGLEDIGTFLRVSTRAPIGFLAQFLGMFRLNADQNTSNPGRRIIKLGHVAWLALALASERAGLVTRAQAWQCITSVGQSTLLKYAESSDMDELREAIAQLIEHKPESEARFLGAWETFVAQPVIGPTGAHS